MDDTTVVILIDALGFEIAARHGFQPGSLSTRCRLKTVLGFSQAALTTIVTGTAVEHHGIWMMYAFARRGSPFGWVRFMPGPASMQRRWMRNLVRWKLDHLDRIQSYYSLYAVPRDVLPYLDLPARRNLFTVGGVDGVHSIFDELKRRGIPVFVRDYRTPEEEAFEELEQSVRRGAASFYLLYTAGLDSLLHRYGTGDARIAERLEWYRKRIERICSIDQRISVYVFGDHGMCDVTERHDLISQVDALGLLVPEDFIPFYDSTVARFKVYTERADSALRSLLTGFHWGRLLGEVELAQLGTFFGNGRYGDLIFVTNGGLIILPSYMSTEMVKGMHGYHPDEECMYGAMLTNTELPEGPLSIGDVARIIVPGFSPRSGGGGW
ncbi:MAG: alkaline phosphatase family protein [bacterium]|nr:MAG: alkaline phosphatase family protein [bacterium]